MMIVNPMAGMYGQMPMQQQYPYQQSYMQQPQYQQQQTQQQQAAAPAAATGEYDPNVYAQWFVPPISHLKWSGCAAARTSFAKHLTPLFFYRYNDYIAYYGQPPGPEYPPPGSAAAAAPSSADADADTKATVTTAVDPADSTATGSGATATEAGAQQKPLLLD